VLVPAETAQAGTIGQVSEGLTWQRDPIAVRSTCQLASRLISKKNLEGLHPDATSAADD